MSARREPFAEIVSGLSDDLREKVEKRIADSFPSLARWDLEPLLSKPARRAASKVLDSDSLVLEGAFSAAMFLERGYGAGRVLISGVTAGGGSMGDRGEVRFAPGAEPGSVELPSGAGSDLSFARYQIKRLMENQAGGECNRWTDVATERAKRPARPEHAGSNPVPVDVALNPDRPAKQTGQRVGPKLAAGDPDGPAARFGSDRPPCPEERDGVALWAVIARDDAARAEEEDARAKKNAKAAEAARRRNKKRHSPPDPS